MLVQVYVGVVNSEHFHIVELLLLQGKHVLCEKPLTLTAWQSSHLLQLAQERQLLLVEVRILQWKGGSIGHESQLVSRLCYL